LIKFKLEYYSINCKIDSYKQTRTFFTSLEFGIFRVQLKFAFRIRPLVYRTVPIHIDYAELYGWFIVQRH